MLYEQTKSYIAQLNDAELAEYIQVGTAAYEPDAVTFAREEYRRRALDPQILADAMNADDARDAARAASASHPLDGGGKIAAFLSGMTAVLRPWRLLLPHPANIVGEHRRNRQRRRYRLAGFASVALLLVVYITFRRFSEPNTRPSFVLDASKPFVVELGRGSGLHGLDTVRIAQTGLVDLQRVKQDTSIESAALRLPAADIEKLVDLINAGHLTSLAGAYSDPSVADGTQWVLWIQQPPAEKSIYCNNAFPKQITAFAGDLDALLQTAGAGSAVWSTIPRQQALDQQSALWDRVRSAK